MTTARTCTTPEDGWSLYSHFLGNLLMSIQLNELDLEEKDEAKRERRERAVNDAWAKLTGYLYMIKHRMRLNGHHGTAADMQQIIDMVVEHDLTDPEVRRAIHAKHEELNASLRAFKENLARLRFEDIRSCAS